MPKVKHCCVPKCKTSTKCDKISFHSFPSDSATKSRWLRNIFNVKYAGTTICNTDNLYVCSKHFEEYNYLSKNTKKLKRGSVPTLFLNGAHSKLISFSDKCKALPPSISCSPSPISENIEEKPLPWRCDENIGNLNYDFPAFTPDSVADHSSCCDKVFLLHTIQDLKQELDEIKKDYIQLDEKYKALLNVNRNENCPENEKSKEEICIAKIKKDAENLNPLATFILDQVYNYSLKKPTWSELTIRQCIAWRYASTKGYEFARRSHILKAPSRSTLNKYMGKFKSGQEISDLIKMRLKTEAENLQKVERICSLIVDDMAIKEKLYYSRPEDKIYGTCSISPQPLGKRPVLANKLLCFVISGFSSKYTIPVGYFFHKSLVTERFYELTLQIIEMVHNCGFTVLRIVCDNHKSNVALFKLFGQGEMKIKIEHPVNPNIPLFCSFDYCHALKNGRNLFLDHDMASSSGTITSEYLKKLYNIQKGCLIKPIPFLTKTHLYPNTFEKMNVLRALQLFSPTVTTTLRYLATYNSSDFKDAHATIEYMENMYQFFMLHDVSDRTQHFKQRELKYSPYVNISDERLMWLSETFPQYIDNIQETSKLKKIKGLSKETAHALKFTAQSTSECIKYLISESNFYYVLTRSFSSDAVESIFSNIRFMT